MEISRPVPLVLGALATGSGIAMLSLDIVFVVRLSSEEQVEAAKVVSIVASVLAAIVLVLLLLLLGRQIRYRNGAHTQDFGHGRQHTYLLAGFGGVFGILSAVASAVLLAIMRQRAVVISKRTISTSTIGLVTAAFVVWALALLSQGVFIICMVIIQRKYFQRQTQPCRGDSEEPQQFPEMSEGGRPRASSIQAQNESRDTTSIESPSISCGHSRAGSDTYSSFRSSLSHAIRPISSKTKLISPPHQKHRPSSIDSSLRERSERPSIEQHDGFDSWDTSAVDTTTRQTVESASPTPPRFLETIPASPTGSRSPSPGFPLDLEPPKRRERSRSYSPANSYRDLLRTARQMSPTESISHEAHIHPLFRSDSPTPPPATTPNTIVTAAPGAGQLISDRQSIRSIHRMTSGSLPSSPLVHSDSLDSIRQAMEREEAERAGAGEGLERTLTPPIPDFVLNGGPRNSLQGYQSRRGTGKGLVSLGPPSLATALGEGSENLSE
jgi:hypothetical protein